MNALHLLDEFVAWVEPVANGWRYLFSAGFRARTHEAWRHEHIGYVIWDIFWGLLGIAVSLAIVYFAVMWAWQVATTELNRLATQQ